MLPLDPSPEEMRAMGEAALAYLIEFIHGLDDAPAEATEGAVELARELRSQPPEIGGEFEALFDESKRAIERTFEYAGPGYLAYIPGGGLYTAALAEFLAQGVNRYAGLWQPSPAVVQIEENVTRWLCDVFDYPSSSQGLLLSGGSMANLSAMVTARHAKLGEDFLDGTYYVSEQAHASVTKAATIAGFSKRNLRLVPTDAELRMDPGALQAAVRADRAAGLRPFLVAPSAGTTNTGAIDPLAAVADVAAAEGLWMHVDGAYGGFFQLTDRGKEWFSGIERSDSVTLDPHKGMFLPYGTGGLVVRDGQALRDAHYEGAAYLQDLPATGELPNYSEYSAELSRDWRGLRVWFPLRLHGVAAFRDALDEKLDLAQVVTEAFGADPNVEVCWRPQLSTVVFRLAGSTSGAADDERQAEFLRRINDSKRVFLSSTRIHGRFVLRVCIVSHRTHRDRIDECIEIVAKAAAELAA
ncbi:MAG: pyridoxal-dependent decarboxylase [Actinomycetota bacterium]|nr:pyridoxal-dependent decarboxylase [Actinomycetota bacterium]